MATARDHGPLLSAVSTAWRPNLSKNTAQAESCYPILVLSAQLSCCVVERFYPGQMKPYSRGMCYTSYKCQCFKVNNVCGRKAPCHKHDQTLRNCDQQLKNLSEIRFEVLVQCWQLAAAEDEHSDTGEQDGRVVGPLQPQVSRRVHRNAEYIVSHGGALTLGQNRFGVSRPAIG